MNNLKLDAEIINNFYSIINGNNITNEPVYNTMVIIIDLLNKNLNEPNIKDPEQFIDDLIEAFDSFYSNEIYTTKKAYNKYTIIDTPNYFIWIRNKFINKLLTSKTTFKDLSDILYHPVEIDGHKEFKTLYERLTSGYYTN